MHYYGCNKIKINSYLMRYINILTEYQNKSRQTKLSCPYNDLFIYYLKGHLKSENHFSGGNFIGNWQEDDFSFLFFKSPADHLIKKLLLKQNDLELLDHYYMSYEDWQGGPVVPFEVGDFRVHPPWLTPDTDDTKNTLILDPGVVFGTGTHPTTFDCIEYINTLFSRQRVRTMMDLGTGTGLLSLAAGKLGCSKIYAIDFNYLAVKTTLSNVRLNGLEDKIFPVQGLAENFINIPTDLLIANIHYDVMKRLVASKGFLKKKWFILSGLLRSQARDIDYQLSLLPVKIIDKTGKDGIWYTYFGEVL